MRNQAVAYAEDPNMLYMTLTTSRVNKNKIEPEATVLIRNSGTENKIGVNLRCSKKWARKLKSLGENIVRLLFLALKDRNHPFYKMEQDFLSHFGRNGQKIPVISKKLFSARFLAEMQKQMLVQPDGKNFRLTARGKWYLGTMNHE